MDKPTSGNDAKRTKSILILEHLTKRYGSIEAVVGTPLTAYHGESIALIGDTGWVNRLWSS